jgi:predicted AAA+ superfamily ATPase
MHGCIDRFVEKELNRSLARSPAVAILGPRQCGKSTTAKLLLKSIPSVYLDLQDRVDRNKLAEPELFFDHHRDKLICLDEIQLLPGFFSILRSEIVDSMQPESAWVIAPVDEPFEIKKGIVVCSPKHLDLE